VHTLQLAEGSPVDPIGRPRGAGALLATYEGTVQIAVEGRGKRIRVREGVSEHILREALRLLLERLLATRGVGRKRHDIIIETIDGVVASSSPHAATLRELGFKREGGGLRYYAPTL
jgi:hypothetical protein